MATRAYLRGLDTTGITELRLEIIPADGMTCSECEKTADGNVLIFTTWRGTKPRTHNGQFCSKLCHDIFHGLKPRA